MAITLLVFSEEKGSKAFLCAATPENLTQDVMPQLATELATSVLSDVNSDYFLFCSYFL
jgi:hypothetical protein